MNVTVVALTFSVFAVLVAIYCALNQAFIEYQSLYEGVIDTLFFEGYMLKFVLLSAIIKLTDAWMPVTIAGFSVGYLLSSTLNFYLSRKFFACALLSLVMTPLVWYYMPKVEISQFHNCQIYWTGYMAQCFLEADFIRALFNGKLLLIFSCITVSALIVFRSLGLNDFFPQNHSHRSNHQ